MKTMRHENLTVPGGKGTGLRILVFAFNYAPERTGGAVTSTGRLQHLARAGHDVTVVSGFPHYPEWMTHEGYRGRFSQRETLCGVNIIRRWHSVPSRQDAFRRATMEATFAVTAIPTGILQRPPNLVLSVTPAVSAMAAGVVAAKRFQVPHGVFILDLAGRSAEQSGMPGGKGARHLADLIEGALLRATDRVAIITEGFRAPLLEMGVRADHIELLTDWKVTVEPSLPRDAVRRLVGLPVNAPLVLHTGNIGYKQGLEHIADAAVLAQYECPALRFVLIGDGNQRAAVQDRVRALGADNVLFLPLQPPDLYTSLLGAVDVLLLHQRARVREMSLPSKLADYFASGRPVVAAVNADSEAAREVERAGGGLVVAPEQPRALVDGIRRLLDDPEQAVALGRAGQDYARRRYTPEVLADALDSFVHQTVARSR